MGDCLRRLTVKSKIASMGILRLRVQELREARGWTQAELARRAAVRPATLNRIELGRTAAIAFDVLDRLAGALEVDPGYLIVRSTSFAKRSRK